ncbi:unnamed protein product [Cyprideis torosa]|uniref:Uncharacterized protein n=1 Tax=Cyprideis torosa TaxID=163714 RepID=A0A7R8ZH62_9CRUS|nr:unnamed protein product [Cyprideis torosa]CAG0882928.1 unnamed protein product [Cyprideis torosa]
MGILWLMRSAWVGEGILWLMRSAWVGEGILWLMRNEASADEETEGGPSPSTMLVSAPRVAASVDSCGSEEDGASTSSTTETLSPPLPLPKNGSPPVDKQPCRNGSSSASSSGGFRPRYQHQARPPRRVSPNSHGRPPNGGMRRRSSGDGSHPDGPQANGAPNGQRCGGAESRRSVNGSPGGGRHFCQPVMPGANQHGVFRRNGFLTETVIVNNEEYTKIQTPRQDVLFKKGWLSGRREQLEAVLGPTATALQDNPSADPDGTLSTNGSYSGEYAAVTPENPVIGIRVVSARDGFRKDSAPLLVGLPVLTTNDFVRLRPEGQLLELILIGSPPPPANRLQRHLR